MNNFDKLDLLGGIDPKYIDKATADPAAYRRRLRRALISAAACICLVVLALVIGGKHSGKQQTPAVNDTNMQASNENSGITAGGEDQPSSPDDGSQPVYNGAQVPGEDPGNTVFNGAQVPGEDPDGGHSGTPARWISSYKEASYDAELIVENGKVVLSESLKKAIDEFGDSTTQMPGDAEPMKTVFRVEVIFFKNGEKLENNSLDVTAEEKRLIIDGYTVTTEELQQDGVTVQLFWTLHATADQLLDFEPLPDLGYYIVLYDEYTGIESDTDAVLNSTNTTN